MSRNLRAIHYSHKGPRPKTDTLITNLGTPDAPPRPAALRRYLKELLSDPRVVEVPRLIWWLVLNLVILPLRPHAFALKNDNFSIELAPAACRRGSTNQEQAVPTCALQRYN